MLVAIDGPAGAGKSTVARALAHQLGFTYLASGAMYRCVALLAIASRTREPAELAREAQIELSGPDTASGGSNPDRSRSGPGDTVRRTGSTGRSPGTESQGTGSTGRSPGTESQGTGFRSLPCGRVPDSESGRAAGPLGRVMLNGREVTEAIRAPEVAEVASRVAADPGVRAALVAKQRELLARGDWVAEGRDIGTVVAPDAELKVFLTASPRERARRRSRELGADPERVLAEQLIRDQRDSTRADSPLKPAAGAVTLDTTDLSLDAVVAHIAELARAARPSP